MYGERDGSIQRLLADQSERPVDHEVSDGAYGQEGDDSQQQFYRQIDDVAERELCWFIGRRFGPELRLKWGVSTISRSRRAGDWPWPFAFEIA